MESVHFKESSHQVRKKKKTFVVQGIGWCDGGWIYQLTICIYEISNNILNNNIVNVSVFLIPITLVTLSTEVIKKLKVIFDWNLR